MKVKLQEIYNWVAKTFIRRIDDNYELTGKYVRVADMGYSIWDTFICNVANLTNPVCTRKLNTIYNAIPLYNDIHKLDGEGRFQTTDIGWLNAWLETNRLLGIKKRKIVPQVTVDALHTARHGYLAQNVV